MELFGRYAEDDLSGFSIRDLKYGRARLAVLGAFSRAIREKSYEDIWIKDLCRAAEISEPGFYNYFPKKEYLFTYFIDLWSIDVKLFSQRVEPGLGRIKEIYKYSACKVGQSSNLLSEVIAYQVRKDLQKDAKNMNPVTLAEKNIVFGNVPGLGKICGGGLNPILKENIRHAIKAKELSSEVSPKMYALILGALFFGMPVMQQTPNNLEQYYESAIDLLSEKARGKEKRRK